MVEPYTQQLENPITSTKAQVEQQDYDQIIAVSYLAAQGASLKDVADRLEAYGPTSLSVPADVVDMVTYHIDHLNEVWDSVGAETSGDGEYVISQEMCNTMAVIHCSATLVHTDIIERHLRDANQMRWLLGVSVACNLLMVVSSWLR